MGNANGNAGRICCCRSRDGTVRLRSRSNKITCRTSVSAQCSLKHPTIAHRVQNYLSSDEPSLRSKSRAASHKPHSAHATQTSFSRMCFHVLISSATTINISKHTAPLTRYRSEIQLSSCNGPRSCVSPSSPRVRCRKACVLYLLQLIRCMDAAKFSEAET